MTTKNCADCGVGFSYEPNPNYADNRKYCDVCSAKSKAKWEATKGAPKIANAGIAKAVQTNANKPTDNRNTTMYVSYAKDIYLGLHEKLTKLEVEGDLDDNQIMVKAIELVIQAQKAFS